MEFSTDGRFPSLSRLLELMKALVARCDGHSRLGDEAARRVAARRPSDSFSYTG